MTAAVEADQVLAFRLARSGLVERDRRGLAEAAACPASDFARHAAMLALAARADFSREEYDRAVDAGEIVVAHVVRGAIHALAPGDFALYGRALISSDDAELTAQLGEQVKRLAAEKGFAPTEALDEVAAATKAALAGGRRLDKNELHEELRARVANKDLLPWCKGCGSHHVAPMLWRYGTVKAGARLDSERRYRSGRPGRAPAAAEPVRAFLGFYGPATPGEFAEWAGLAKPHATRLWERAGELAEARVGGTTGWLLPEDLPALESPPAASGIRLIPPGDPYLQKPNRPLLTPAKALRKRLFRPVASPGAVLKDGRLSGLWRVKANRGRAELTVEKLAKLTKKELDPEAQRVAELRGEREAAIALS
jgi:hypothetical protein